ncbi:hypothetical protein HDU87_004654 [Geranomyces variabilis]|uniref:SCP domain-containing protein n=1 Tax=Geranomyces variabilis TaxID=109894 RepID=A0AAD5TNI0_9FUNG|nr:hypothetical protein HDU87_004654 [Geranomyces variabilis]
MHFSHILAVALVASVAASPIGDVSLESRAVKPVVVKGKTIHKIVHVQAKPAGQHTSKHTENLAAANNVVKKVVHVKAGGAHHGPVAVVKHAPPPPASAPKHGGKTGVKAPAPRPKPLGPLPHFNAQDCLSSHNQYRAMMGKRSLSWSSDLQARAQNWANHLADQSNGALTLVHEGPGENLYGATGNPSCHNAIQMWFDEKPNYHGERIVVNDAFETYGHYTQLIWGTTTEVGCALGSTNAGGHTSSFIVCKYNPPGNYIGELVP